MNVLRKIKKIVLYLIDFPKSLYVNLKCLSFKEAIKLPIRIKWNVKLGKLYKNCIKIKTNEIKRSMILIGYRGSKFISNNNMYISISNGGQIIFYGSCIIAEGLNICVYGGTVSIGDNLYVNKNFNLQCEKGISFGKDVLIGWNVSIRDTDGHKIIENNIEKEEAGNISIKNHVWVASNVTILKNTNINNNSVIACNSTVSSYKSNEQNILIGGTPAKKIKENINWKE